MKILYIHQYFTALDGNGPTRSYEFARRLIAQGHEVTMLTSTAYLPEPYKSSKSVLHESISGIPTIIIPVPYANAMSFPRRIRAFISFALRSCIEAVKTPVDVVFASSAPLTVAIPGIVAKLWLRKPMVFEVRDLWPEMPIAIGALKDPLTKSAAQALEWLAYHMAVHIVALSPGMAEGIIERGIAPERVTVIPNSCDIDLFTVPPEAGEAVRQELGIGLNQPLIVYTGQFGVVYGVDYLVDVAGTMLKIDPEVRFLLVGTGKERERLTRQAEALGVLNKTLFIWEPVPKSKIPAIMSAATVSAALFIPLKPMWKNSSNKFFDALAAGKPLMMNYGGWQADIVRETGAGIVVPEDDRARAAQDLADLLHDPERLKGAAQAARQLAVERFNREEMAQKLVAVLTAAASH